MGKHVRTSRLPTPRFVYRYPWLYRMWTKTFGIERPKWNWRDEFFGEGWTAQHRPDLLPARKEVRHG